MTKSEPRQYVIDCKITRRTQVIVDAENEAEAIAKFEGGEWNVDDAWYLAETIDWERVGPPELNK